MGRVVPSIHHLSFIIFRWRFTRRRVIRQAMACTLRPACGTLATFSHEVAKLTIDPATFNWTDADWPGMKIEGQVIYEMHIATFTPAGTWEAAAAEFEELARIGITVLEVMPISEFPGRFGWGYDGVDWYAPTHLY